MAEEKKNISLWQRLRDKYRISIINEDTLAEHWYLHLSGWGAIVVAAIIFLITMGVFSLIILYTPVKNYLPGYSEDIRTELMEESARIDSLGTALELQRQYLQIIKQVVAGEVESDTVQSLDSMQIIMREQLLEAKAQATQDFLLQYEEEEKNNIYLFETRYDATSHIPSFYVPAKGIITTHFSEPNKQYSIHIKTTNQTQATAVLDGTIIHINHTIDDTYTLILQHANYLSIYNGIGRCLKQQGEFVTAGEIIGMLKNELLEFELWKDNKPINPEKLIAF